MIKTICVCDKCRKECKQLISFQIICKTKDSHCNLGNDKKSERREYCSSCFNDLLDDIGMRELK